MALRPISDPALLARLNGANASPQPVQIAPADPYKARDANRADAAAARDQVRLENDLSKPQILGDSGFMFDPRTRKALPIPGFTPKSKSITPERRAELNDKLTALRNMENSLGQLDTLYQRDLAGQPLSRGFGLMEYFQTPAMQEFDKAAKQMGPYVMSALGMSGKATDAAAEYERKVMPFIPSSRSTDGANERTLRNLRDMIENQYRSTYSELGKPYKPKPRPKAKSGGDDGWKIEVLP